jgi:dihydrofolate reductase
MGNLITQMSMSLDGFIAGPNPSSDNPLGDNGLGLHEWYESSGGHDFGKDVEGSTGAIIMGTVMYHESLPWWHGSGPLGDDVPCFVLTEKDHEPKEAAGVFTFVTGGIEEALRRARVAAGDKDVLINGGANTIQQYIKAGLIDEMYIHVVPVLLGGGTSLFGALGDYIELDKITAADEKEVTHLAYRFKQK